MTWVVMVMVMLPAAVLQLIFPAPGICGHAKFPFLLAVVVYYALRRERPVALWAGMLVGLLQDALSPRVPLGTTAVIYMLVAWGVGRFREFVMGDSPVTSGFFGGICGIMVSLASYGVLAAQDLVSYSTGVVIWRAAGTGFLAMLCTPPVFWFAWQLDAVVGNVMVKANIDAAE